MPQTNLFHHIRINVQAALAEDMGSGDLTAQLIAEHTKAHATVITREPAVLCGTLWFEECFLTLDPDCKITWISRKATLPRQTSPCARYTATRARCSRPSARR